MCVCRPEIRTPWCGRPGCESPDTLKAREQVRASCACRTCRADEALDLLALLLARGQFFPSCIELEQYEGGRTDGEDLRERIVALLRERGRAT